ncbi:2Fe-2S iron-sulfur cluster binding domain-containing protein [Aneurinibacillus sp. BA2021]|nr:2Fe-2S iron-sulfur cluster binding domain-containing protein [Aneurinibacillus sp. BA2021]
MPKVTFAPAMRQIQVRTGETILRAASKARVAISQRCGGKGACTMCKVQVRPDSLLSPPLAKEKQMIGEKNLACGLRLACQARIQGETHVQVAESRMQAVVRAQLEKQRQEREE